MSYAKGLPVTASEPPSTAECDLTSGLEIQDDAVRRRIRRDGIVGLGETYEQGRWTADRLDDVMCRIFTSPAPHLSPFAWSKLLLTAFDQRLFNRQAGRGAFNIGRKHYDLGNSLFRCMLDESMTYTCGYWANAKTLDEAQEAKIDLICRKLDLQPHQHVLDIGCGWGNFARHAARNCGARVTGITVSREQADLARERCDGLPVEIRLQDYREIDEVFDHVVSIEMIEAVGRRNLPTFYRVVDRSLKQGGLFVLQVIFGNTLTRTSDRRLDQFILWLLKYIFPNGYLPRSDELVPPRDTDLRIEDWQRYVDDYERTLLAWATRFNDGWDGIADQYDDSFRRRWNFYLHGCAAAFRARLVDVGQIVYAKGGWTSRLAPSR
jgi:cyclopropane-fatty-acyl-phospholipid synthase